LIAVALLATPALANNRDRKLCYKPSAVEVKLAACARLISSGSVRGRDLAYAYQQRGATLVARNDYDGALAETNETIRLSPDIWEAYHTRCTILEHLKRYEEALSDCNTSIRLYPKYAMSYHIRSVVLIRLGRYEQAMTDVTSAMGLAKPQYYNFATRGHIYLKIGDYDRALPDLDRAHQLAPTDSRVYRDRGLVYEGKKNYVLAAADLQKAITLDPTLQAARDGLARIEQRKVAQAAMASGAAHFSGTGVPRDLTLAYRWFNTAATFFPEGPERAEALASRDYVAGHMSPAELASAQKSPQ